MNEKEAQTIKIIEENQQGQTLIEFLLLLSSIAIISFGFLSTVNTRIADKWLQTATILVEDESQPLELQ